MRRKSRFSLIGVNKSIILPRSLFGMPETHIGCAIRDLFPKNIRRFARCLPQQAKKRPISPLFRGLLQQTARSKTGAFENRKGRPVFGAPFRIRVPLSPVQRFPAAWEAAARLVLKRKATLRWPFVLVAQARSAFCSTAG